MPSTSTELGQERQLVARAQAGDEFAFAELVECHRPMLHGVCTRIVGETEEAEDAVQNALIAAWQNLEKFQGRARFSTWLYRIAHNAALAVVRKRVPEPAESVVDTASDLRSIDAIVSDVDAVRWALDRIPPDFRAALVLREYAELTYEEIAEVQGIKLATVKTRISRARQAVAKLLEE